MFQYKKIICFLGVLVCFAITGAGEVHFRKGDRIGLFGDSITQGGSYAAYLQMFLAGTDVQIINIGLSGDTSSAGVRRIPTLLKHVDMNVVCYMLGVNDVKPQFFKTPEMDDAKKAVFDNFRKSASKSIELYQQNGKRVMISTPCAYNQYSEAHTWNVPYKDSVGVAGISAISRELAAKYKIPFFDIQTPTRELFQKFPKVKFAPDRLHPERFVHVIIAANLARQWGLSPDIGDVRITGNSAVVKAGKVENLKRKNNTVSFDYTPARLPIGSCKDVEEARKYYDLDTLINRETLSVTDLPAGEYDLFADGEKLGRFSAEQLKKGIKLTSLATPHQKRADENMKMQKEIEDTMRYYSINYRFRFIVECYAKKNYDDAEQRRAYMKKWCENGQKDRRLARNFRSVYEQFLKHIDGREKEIVTRSRILAERLHNASRPSVCRMLLKPVK